MASKVRWLANFALTVFFQCVNLEQLNLRRTIRSRKRIPGGGGLGWGRPSVIFRPSALPHLVSYPYTPVCRIRLPVLGVFSQCGREKTTNEERNSERGKTAGREKRRTCRHQSAGPLSHRLPENLFAFHNVNCQNDQKLPLSSHSCSQEQANEKRANK